MGSDMAPGVAGLGAGAGAAAGYENATPEVPEGAGLRYRRTQNSGQGQGGPEGYYDAAAAAGGYLGPPRVPDGGYAIARYAPQAGYNPSQNHGGYPDPQERNGFSDNTPYGGTPDSQQYLAAGVGAGAGSAAGSAAYLPNPHAQSTAAPGGGGGEERASAAYGGFEDGDPFAAQSQLSHTLSHSQGGHSVSPQPLLSGGSPPPQQQHSAGSHEGPLMNAFGPRMSDEGREAASDAGSLGDEEDYAGGRRILKVANE